MKKVLPIFLILCLLITSMPLVMANTDSTKIHYSDFIQQLDKAKEEKDYKNTASIEEKASLKVSTTTSITDPGYTNQTNLQRINIEGAWSQSLNNYTTKVAIIDSGLNVYDDLNGSNIIDGYSIINGTKTAGIPTDSTFHGTQIAAIIAAQKNSIGIAGISPNTKIIPIKVSQTGGKNSSSDTAAGIQYAINKGANIIYLNTSGTTYNETLEKAIETAYENNILVIAPTGDTSKLNEVDYPAAYDHVISVGATNNSDSILSSSNKGTELDIVAPGKDIYLPETTTTYKKYSGTAYAGATVTGVAALIKSSYPGLSNTKIEQILLTATADLTSVKGWDWDSGYGRIDANKALTLAKNISWDNNDSPSTAKPISFNQKQSGTLYPARDIDMYKITLSKPGKVVVEANAPTGTDIMLSILDSQGYIYDYIDDGGQGENETLQTEILTKGTYYIQVFDYYGDYNNTESYQVNIINPINKADSIRFAGKDKWATSSLISKSGWQSSENLVLAYGNKFHDALSGAPFAFALNAPILLTDKNTVPSEIMKEINRIKPKNIYVLGGYLVVSDSLLNQLKSKGFNVKRVWGATKYHTAVQAGEELRTRIASDTAVLAYGDNYPDALAISGIAAENNWPILFTNTKTLNTETQKALKDWKIKNVKVVGGTLVISTNIENQLKSMGISVEQL